MRTGPRIEHEVELEPMGPSLEEELRGKGLGEAHPTRPPPPEPAATFENSAPKLPQPREWLGPGHIYSDVSHSSMGSKLQLTHGQVNDLLDPAKLKSYSSAQLRDLQGQLNTLAAHNNQIGEVRSNWVKSALSFLFTDYANERANQAALKDKIASTQQTLGLLASTKAEHEQAQLEAAALRQQNQELSAKPSPVIERRAQSAAPVDLLAQQQAQHKLELSDQAARFQERIDGLQQRIGEMVKDHQEELEHLKDERDKAVGKETGLRQHIARLQVTLKEARGNTAGVKKELAAAEQELGKLSREQEARATRLRKVSADLDQERAQIELLHKGYTSELESQRRFLQKQIDDAQVRLRQATSVVSTLQDQVGSGEVDQMLLQAHLNRAEKHKAELRVELETAQRRAAQSDDLEKQVGQLSQDLDVAVSHIDRLRNRPEDPTETESEAPVPSARLTTADIQVLNERGISNLKAEDIKQWIGDQLAPLKQIEANSFEDYSPDDVTAIREALQNIQVQNNDIAGVRSDNATEHAELARELTRVLDLIPAQKPTDDTIA